MKFASMPLWSEARRWSRCVYRTAQGAVACEGRRSARSLRDETGLAGEDRGCRPADPRAPRSRGAERRAGPDRARRKHTHECRIAGHPPAAHLQSTRLGRARHADPEDRSHSTERSRVAAGAHRGRVLPAGRFHGAGPLRPTLLRGSCGSGERRLPPDPGRPDRILTSPSETGRSRRRGPRASASSRSTLAIRPCIGMQPTSMP